MTADRGPPQERRRIPSCRPDDARIDRSPIGRNPEQRVRLDTGQSKPVVAREPLREGRPDPLSIRGPARDRDHGPAQSPVETVDVDHVEPTDHDAIEQDGAQVGQVPGRLDQRSDSFVRVAAIDLDAPDPDRLDVARKGHHDGRERSAPVHPLEPAVVDRHDADVGLGQRAT